jgi:hypothetical protein
MPEIPRSPLENAEEYAQRRRMSLSSQLGRGVNGSVWYTSLHSVVKAFEKSDAYERERDAYLRLADLAITHINEFAVPQLEWFDDELGVIEMQAVQPPFVLDFAGAYLDSPPEFPQEVMQQHEVRNANLFGKFWPRVRLLLAKLRSMGIYYIDVNRGNIRFPEFDDEADLSESSSPSS